MGGFDVRAGLPCGRVCRVGGFNVRAGLLCGRVCRSGGFGTRPYLGVSGNTRMPEMVAARPYSGLRLQLSLADSGSWSFRGKIPNVDVGNQRKTSSFRHGAREPRLHGRRGLEASTQSGFRRSLPE
ncbi:MAG: hypothetical protein WCI11_12415 [Candidatus Methylumidiphilus sp.]